MRRDGQYRAFRWALLLTLAFAVLAMHHVGPPEPTHNGTAHGSSAVAPGPDPAVVAAAEPGGANHHGLLYHCLAILGAASLIVLGLWLWRASETAAVRTRFPASEAAARGPPSRDSRTVLRLNCVLRI